jgi:hypothetical protein
LQSARPNKLAWQQKNGSHVAEKSRYVYSALIMPSLRKLDRDAV